MSCPHYAAAKFFVRAGDRAYLEVLEKKVRQIAEGAALMTETTVEISYGRPTCYDMRPSYPIGRVYEENMRRGRDGGQRARSGAARPVLDRLRQRLVPRALGDRLVRDQPRADPRPLAAGRGCLLLGFRLRASC